MDRGNLESYARDEELLTATDAKLQVVKTESPLVRLNESILEATDLSCKMKERLMGVTDRLFGSDQPEQPQDERDRHAGEYGLVTHSVETLLDELCALDRQLAVLVRNA